MAPSRRRYSSDSSPSESSSEDERQRRGSSRDRNSEKNKACSSSDESSDLERDRVKARGSKDDGGRRRRHDNDDVEAKRKAAPRVSRDKRRGRDDRGERNKKSYSSDESDERGRGGRRRYDSDDDEEAEMRWRRLDDRAYRESDDKKERPERLRKDGEDQGADRVRQNVDEEPEGLMERNESSRKDDEDRKEHARRSADEGNEEQKDRRERSRKDEGDRIERVRRNSDEDRRGMPWEDVDCHDDNKWDRDERDRDERKFGREPSRRDDNDDNKRDRAERKLHREPSRRDGSSDNQRHKNERKLDRERSRRDGDDDSIEEGELTDRKDERLKHRKRELRAESSRRRDRYREERRHRDGDGKRSRDKGRSSSDEDEKRDDRARKRDRDSSPRRRDRKREERRHRDSDGGSPRRKEGNGDVYDRRNTEKERSREKDAKEESKVEESAPIQQMPDAGVIKTGGIYIPPHRMAQMMREVQDKSSEQYQRLSWDALKKSINGLVNKVNAANIKNIIPELFSENLIRGRGLFCRSCMKSQMTSPGFTDVFAALVAVVNTKIPEVGKLLLKRIVLQLRRAYKRNDKPQLLAATKFIAHLVNQQVAHEIIALELLTLLLETPTDDSVEVAVGFVKECGALLQDFSPQGLHGIFERFRGILHEGEIDKRVQFLIEGLFAIRKAKFQGFPAVRPELDLVEHEDQFTHEVSLEDEIDPETSLDVFKANPQFLEDEKAYEDVKKSILGDESSDGEEGSDADSEDEDEEESEEDDDESMKIKDETETNLVNLRRTIYLTIMSSVDFEEAGHKLLKIKLEPGQEMELCIMLLECCSQERTYLRYYGLLGQRFCMINKVYQENFEKCFVQQYSMIHRLETNKLRNVAKFFAHLLGTNALPWHVLAYIRLTEEDTTSSSRIFIKILFQELSEHLGIRLLNERLNDPMMQDSFESIFPKDNPKNTRFAINFFTSIGLGGITESLREYLKNMPRLIMQQQKPVSESDDDSGSSSASSSDSASSGADSEDESESDSSSDERERRDRHSKRRRRN